MGVKMSDFKKGDEIWWIKTHGYHGDIQKYDYVYLEHGKIIEIDETIYHLHNGDHIFIEDSWLCFKSKSEAIDAMIKHLEGLKDE